MVPVLLQWNGLISLLVKIPTCHLLSVFESDNLASVIPKAKESYASTKRSLPLQQQLFLDVFVNVIVGIAYMPHSIIAQTADLPLSNTTLSVINFEHHDYLTRAWADTNISRRQGAWRRIRTVLYQTFPASHHDQRPLYDPQPVIIVKLVPGWWNIASLLLSMVYLAVLAGPCGKTLKEASTIIVVPGLVLVTLARYTFRIILKAREEAKVDEKQGIISDRKDNHQTSFGWQQQISENPRPEIRQYKTWCGTGAQIGQRMMRTLSSDTTSQTLSYSDYTVGWICALPIELAAAQAMLDEVHDSLPAREYDDNTYVLGRIFCHNVVLTCLPTGIYGPVTAATVATRMLSTFQSIRFGLMVGIGGGVPSQADIRLGDVVVSKPTKHFGGVVQCGTDFELTSTLNNPPHALLNALTKLRADHLIRGNRISEFVSTMLDKYPILRDSVAPCEADRLFRADYEHPSASRSCNSCDKSYEVNRTPRASSSPQAHYGRIASITQVMKNGVTRDRIAQRLGNLCFEMEAAGLMDNFPCLVIRGISDYADSHKNDHWHGYAAATAAAYARELLSVVPRKEVTSERAASRL